jgi:four helix bundle protein
MAVDARPVRNFRELHVWKLGKELVLGVYRVTGSFPREETYGLVAQMRRAAVSIPCNVAEGFNRRHNREYRQFLYVALGSCAELETQTDVSCELGYLNHATRSSLLDQLDHEARMLQNLIKRL